MSRSDTTPSRQKLPTVPVPAAGAPGTGESAAGEAGAQGVGAEPRVTLYEAVGGEETFRALVHAFYERVAVDPVLRPLYPEEDLSSAEERLRLFLIQYWGGPRTYEQVRGHPRLRMRHAPFFVGPEQRDAWLANMRAAMDTVGFQEPHDAVLWDYFVRAAFSLQNQD